MRGGCRTGGYDVCGLSIELECRETANGVDVDDTFDCWRG